MTAGCLEGCTQTAPWRALWTEPGLFDSLPDLGTMGSYRVETTPPEPGMRLDDAHLEAEWGEGRFNLSGVQWVPPNGDSSGAETYRVRWDTPDRVQAFLFAPYPRRELLVDFKTFAGTMFDIPAKAMPALAEAFASSLDTNRRGAPYEVEVPYPNRIMEALADAREDGTLRPANRDPGSSLDTSLTSGKWTYEFWLAQKLLVPQNASDPMRPLRVDAGDHVTYGSFDGERPTPSSVQEHARAFFASHALPAPTFQAMSVHGELRCT